MESPYIFVWGNTQSHLTIDNFLQTFSKFKNVPWNNNKKVILISKENKISCFFSKEDLTNDRELGKIFLDEEETNKFISATKDAYRQSWNFFNQLKNTKF